MREDSLTDMFGAAKLEAHRYTRVLVKAGKDSTAKHERRTFVCEI